MKKVREEAVKMFMVLMFTLLPLYYSDNYYNILNDKRDIYWLGLRGFFADFICSYRSQFVHQSDACDKKPSIFKKYEDTA